ncbi:MAG: DUF1150 family protein [Alphaproteobacteria bacterium]|nr:DUF1150 family protein [Alphaproteobacteria bacterium]
MNNPAGDKYLYNEGFAAIANAAPVAYIRPLLSGNSIIYAVCTADGTQLATFNTQEAAFFAARQHELEPMYMH